jgi:hypothetical protein
VSHLDRAVLHRVEHLQARHNFAGGENLDLEFVVGGLGDALGHVFRTAVKRVERLRPAGRQPPFHFRHRLGNGRRSHRGGRKTHSRSFQELTTFHSVSPVVLPTVWRLGKPYSERRALLSPTINARS